MRLKVMIGTTLNGMASVQTYALRAFAQSTHGHAPANALGIRRIMFAVDDIDDVVAACTPMVPN